MIKVLNRFKRDGKYMALAECPFCKKHFELDASNINKTKSCGCVTNELIAKANIKHGAYSQYYPDHDLRNAIETISLMNLRVKSDQHPRYHQICDLLNTTINGRIDPAKWLLENFGPKKPDHSIERIDNNIGYVCGDWSKCEYCKERKLNCNIFGYIPTSQQKFNKSNTTTFVLNGNRFCFNRLNEYVPVPQTQLDYFWYRKHDHLDKYERYELMKDKLFKDCDSCLEIELLN